MGRRSRYSEEFRQELCDYVIDNPETSLREIAGLFGIDSGLVSKWLKDDPRYEPRRKKYDEQTIKEILAFYHDSKDATIDSTIKALGLSVSAGTISLWLLKYPEYRKEERLKKKSGDKRAICEYAIAHPELSRWEVIQEFGYPSRTITLSKWLYKLYGIEMPESRNPKTGDLNKAVAFAFAHEDTSIADVARMFDVSRKCLYGRMTMDPRWKSDKRSKRNKRSYELLKKEVIEFYFENQSMNIAEISGSYGGVPTPSAIARWVREDPRYLDPATYGFTEEQKALAVDMRFANPNLEFSRLCKEIGFPLNERALRCWCAADPRASSLSKPRKERVKLDLQDRVDVVEDVRRNGLGIEEAASRYKITTVTVKNYLKRYDSGGYVALMGKDQIPKRGKNLQVSKPSMKISPEGMSHDQIEELIRRNKELEKRNEELQFENDVCHAIFEVLKKDPGLNGEKFMSNREKTMVINSLRPMYKLKVLLKRFDISKSSYEYQRNALLKPDKYLKVRAFVRDAFEKSGHAYGYRRITAVLRMPVLAKDEKGISGYGVVVDEKVVRRLMKEEKIITLPAMRLLRFNSYRGTVGKVAPNLLKRDFSSDAPYKKLLTDVTEFHLNNYKIYLSPVIDCFNGEVISWTVSQSPNLDLVVAMLKHAIRRVGRKFDVIIHSDQGWAYQHAVYRQMLKDAGWTQSMSRKGCCSDNSAMEGFFGRLKNEFFYNHDFAGYTPEEFMEALNNWITWYNEVRIKETLGYTSPALYREQWELKHTELALAA